MASQTFTTAGGISGTCTATPLDASTALDGIWAAIDRQRGGLFVSNYEVPDRYSRWDTGFVNPPISLVAKGRRFELHGLNGEGERLLTLLAPTLRDHADVEDFQQSARLLGGRTKEPPTFFPEEERSRQPSLFSVIRAIMDLLRCEQPALGLYGAFGFDLVLQFETLALKHARDPEQVDCVLFLPTELVVVDRQKEVATRYVYDFDTPAGRSRDGDRESEIMPLPPALPPGPVAADHGPGVFQAKVEQVRQGCRAGDFFEVVLSQSFAMPYGGTPGELFQRICANNPSPYSFLINMGTEQLVGASPEMFVRVSGRQMETSPISGTVPVGDSAMETAAHIKQLIGSEKEESELTMCTDVDRNDMTRVCVPGSVELIGRRLIETYSRLVHTVDHVRGELADGYDALDAFVTHLWACTVTGSPKPMALQTIENLEAGPRRWYAGAIGYLNVNGDLNTGMTLRTVHLEGGRATVRAGATLLYDSEPETEERETRVKASAFLEATLGQSRPRPKPGGAERRPDCGAGKRVLFVDFLDSFVHTLASYVRVTGATVQTVRAGFPLEYLERFNPDLIFLSPGPGTPEQRGVHDVVRLGLGLGVPLFGVCLGHQGIAEVLGADLGVLDTPVHGKPAAIAHNGQGIFRGLPAPFEAARYHSLYVKPDTLPPELEVTATAQDGVIMGLQHRSLPVASVQFHPESILTLRQETGQRLIENIFAEFLDRH